MASKLNLHLHVRVKETVTRCPGLGTLNNYKGVAWGNTSSTLQGVGGHVSSILCSSFHIKSWLGTLDLDSLSCPAGVPSSGSQPSRFALFSRNCAVVLVHQRHPGSRLPYQIIYCTEQRQLLDTALLRTERMESDGGGEGKE